jgi:hypothetical protein
MSSFLVHIKKERERETELFGFERAWYSMNDVNKHPSTVSCLTAISAKDEPVCSDSV